MSTHTLQPLIWLARSVTIASVASRDPGMLCRGAELLGRVERAGHGECGVLDSRLGHGACSFWVVRRGVGDRSARRRRGRGARTSDAKSPTAPRCASLSGFTTELMLRISPPAMSSDHTLISRCWPSRTIAPGPPFTSIGRSVKSGSRGDDAHPGEQRAGDAVATAQRPRQRRDLAAAVAGQDHVVREQGLEPGQIAVLGGGEKPSA